MNGKKRGGPPERLGKLVDFSKYIPREIDPEREREWNRELALRAADQRRRERRQRLEAARELRLTDNMYAALVHEAGLDPTPSLKAAQAWAIAPTRPCLVLNGQTGCGKSVAAAWVLSQLQALWLPAKQAVRIFSASFGEQYDDQAIARDCPLLVLDDVGVEDEHERMMGVLTELLEARKDLRHRTLITTNLAKPKFEAQYPNPRLQSRIAELVQWAGSTGPDLRRKTKGPAS